MSAGEAGAAGAGAGGSGTPVNITAMRERLTKAYHRCLMVRATDEMLVKNALEFKQRVQAHYAERSLDRVASLINAAMAHLLKSESDPTPVCITLLLLAKETPALFDNAKIVPVLMAVFRTSLRWPNENRATVVRSVAGRVVSAALRSSSTWPLELVLLYVDDALGRRAWVDNPNLSSFVTQIKTAFTMAEEASTLPPSSSSQAPTSPEGAMSPGEGWVEDESVVTPAETHPTSIAQRFVGCEKSVAQVCVDAVLQLKPTSISTSSIASAMTILCRVPGVGAAAAKQMQMWLNVSSGTRKHLQDLILVMNTIVWTGARAAFRPLLMLKLPSTPVVADATKDLIDVFVTALMYDTNHDTAKLTQRAKSALTRDFEGKGTLQDTAAVKLGFEMATDALTTQAAELINKTLLSAKDPRNKLRAFVRRLSRIDSFRGAPLCHHMLRLMRVTDLSALQQTRLVAVVTHFIEVYAQVLACFVGSGPAAQILDAFTAACDRPFTPTHKDSGNDNSNSSGTSNLSSQLEDSKDHEERGGTVAASGLPHVPESAAHAKTTLDERGLAVKQELATAQEGALLWLLDILRRCLRETPPGYIAYQLRRLFFLGDPKSFLGRTLAAATATGEAAGYTAVARHHQLSQHVVPAIANVALRRSDFLGSDALDILSRIVGNATTFHVHFGINIHFPEAETLVQQLLHLCVYAVRANVVVPPGFAAPSLVLGTAYQQALLVIFCLSAFNADVLRAAWTLCPALRTIISAAVTRNYNLIPQATMTAQETDWVLEYERHLAMTFKEVPPTRATSKLLGKVDIVHPNALGNQRPLSPTTVQAVKELDEHVNMQAVLLDWKDPDMMQRVLAWTQEQASTKGRMVDLSWLSGMLALRQDLIDRVPSDVLGRLLLATTDDTRLQALLARFMASLQGADASDLHRLVLDLLSRLHHPAAHARKAARFVVACIVARTHADAEAQSGEATTATGASGVEGVEADAASPRLAGVIHRLLSWCSAARASAAAADMVGTVRDALLTAALHEADAALAANYLLGIHLHALGGEDTGMVWAVLYRTALVAHARPLVLTHLLHHPRAGEAMCCDHVLRVVGESIASTAAHANRRRKKEREVGSGKKHGQGAADTMSGRAQETSGGENDDEEGTRSKRTKTVPRSATAYDDNDNGSSDDDEGQGGDAPVVKAKIISSMCVAAVLGMRDDLAAVTLLVRRIEGAVRQHFGGMCEAVRALRPCKIHATALRRLGVLPAVVAVLHLHLWLRVEEEELAVAVFERAPTRLLLMVLGAATKVSTAAVVAAMKLLSARANTQQQGEPAKQEGEQKRGAQRQRWPKEATTQRPHGSVPDTKTAPLERALRLRFRPRAVARHANDLSRALDVARSMGEHGAPAATALSAYLADAGIDVGGDTTSTGEQRATLRGAVPRVGIKAEGDASLLPSTGLTGERATTTAVKAGGSTGAGRVDEELVAGFARVLSASPLPSAAAAARVLARINGARGMDELAVVAASLAQAAASSGSSSNDSRDSNSSSNDNTVLGLVGRRMVLRIHRRSVQLRGHDGGAVGLPDSFTALLGTTQVSGSDAGAGAGSENGDGNRQQQQGRVQFGMGILRCLARNETPEAAVKLSSTTATTGVGLEDVLLSALVSQRNDRRQGTGANSSSGGLTPPEAEEEVVALLSQALQHHGSSKIGKLLLSSLITAVERRSAQLAPLSCRVLRRLYHATNEEGGKQVALALIDAWAEISIPPQVLPAIMDLLLRCDAAGRLQLSHVLHSLPPRHQRQALHHVSASITTHVNGQWSETVAAWDAQLTQDTLVHLCSLVADRSCLPHNKDKLLLEACAVARAWAWVWTAAGVAAGATSPLSSRGGGEDESGSVSASNGGEAMWLDPPTAGSLQQQQRWVAVLRTRQQLWPTLRSDGKQERESGGLLWLLLDVEACVRYILYALGVLPSLTQHKTPAMPSAALVAPSADATATERVLALANRIQVWPASAFPGWASSQSIASAKLRLCTALLGACRQPTPPAMLRALLAGGHQSEAGQDGTTEGDVGGSAGAEGGLATALGGEVSGGGVHVSVSANTRTDTAVHRLVARLLAPQRRRTLQPGTFVTGGGETEAGPQQHGPAEDLRSSGSGSSSSNTNTHQKRLGGAEAGGASELTQDSYAVARSHPGSTRASGNTSAVPAGTRTTSPTSTAVAVAREQAATTVAVGANGSTQESVRDGAAAAGAAGMLHHAGFRHPFAQRDGVPATASAEQRRHGPFESGALLPTPQPPYAAGALGGMQRHAQLRRITAVAPLPAQFDDDLALALDDLSVSRRPPPLCAVVGGTTLPVGREAAESGSGDSIVGAVLAEVQQAGRKGDCLFAQKGIGADGGGGGGGGGIGAEPDLVEDDLRQEAWLLLLNPDASQLAFAALLCTSHRHPLAVCAALPEVAVVLQGLLHFTGAEMVKRRYHSLFVHAAAVVAAVGRRTHLEDWEQVGAQLAVVVDPFVDVLIYHADSSEVQMQVCVKRLAQHLLELTCHLAGASAVLANYISSFEAAARKLRDPVLNHMVWELSRTQSRTTTPLPLLQPFEPRVGRTWEVMLAELRRVLLRGSHHQYNTTFSVGQSRMGLQGDGSSRNSSGSRPLGPENHRIVGMGLRSLLTLCHRFPSTLRGVHDIVRACMEREETDVARAGYVLATLCVLDHPRECADLLQTHCRIVTESPWLPAVKAALRASHIMHLANRVLADAVNDGDDDAAAGKKGNRSAVTPGAVLRAALLRCRTEPTLDIIKDAPHLWAMIV